MYRFSSDLYILGILDYIKNRYEDILNSTELGSVSGLIKTAQKLLADMKDRDVVFESQLDGALTAHESAKNTLQKVDDWNLESANLTKQFELISESLNDTKNRLLDLQEKAGDALVKSSSAEKQLEDLRELITELQDNTKNIKTMRDALEKTIEEAGALTIAAEDFVQNATATFKVINVNGYQI